MAVVVAHRQRHLVEHPHRDEHKHAKLHMASDCAPRCAVVLTYPGDEEPALGSSVCVEDKHSHCDGDALKFGNSSADPGKDHEPHTSF